MDRESYEEGKATLDQISHLLKEGNLTEEERQRLESSANALAGQLLSIWWPFDWGRRAIIITLFLIGLFGLIQGNSYLLLAWPVLVVFSPRAVGEISLLVGKVSRALSGK